MLDIWGQPLSLGDIVAFPLPETNTMKIGKIINMINDQFLKIEFMEKLDCDEDYKLISIYTDVVSKAPNNYMFMQL